jgi:CRISPR-associated protein Csm4
MVMITRVLLESDAPFHFGKRGVGLNETEVTLPADGLFSALCIAFQMVYGTDALTSLLARFPRDKGQAKTPPFRITSLMPTANSVDLLPMPQLRPKITTVGLTARKQWKEIAWVSRHVFQKLIAGQDLSDDEEVVERRGAQNVPYTIQDGAVWLDYTAYRHFEGESTVLWQTDIRPRVTVDRVSTASTAFSSGGLYFSRKHKAGLYALIRWETEDAQLRQQVEQAWCALGESGIGGERSYGYGQFQPTFTNIADDLGTKDNPYFTTLSPYLPQPSERAVFDENARYEIVLRRGWMSTPGYSHLRRPTIRMVGTGAVLRQLSDPGAIGALANATPDILQGTESIRIYRYGLAWPVPVAEAALIDDQQGA